MGDHAAFVARQGPAHVDKHALGGTEGLDFVAGNQAVELGGQPHVGAHHAPHQALMGQVVGAMLPAVADGGGVEHVQIPGMSICQKPLLQRGQEVLRHGQGHKAQQP